MSSQFDPSPNHKKNSNKDFSLKLQSFYMPTQNPQPILNYSFQTGEEFALEFIQERINSNNANQIQVPIISPTEQRRKLTNKKISKMENVTEVAGAKIQGLPKPEKNTSRTSKGSSRMFQPPLIRYNFARQNFVKFLCSFGGKFLPRPSDGKTRYVGGETHILRLRKDTSWKEVIEKTTRLSDGTHTIRYQSPRSEHLNVPVSVSCDEDVRHMMEECELLQGGDKKPRLFLFSSLDDEKDNEIDFTDTDSEPRFVAAINAVTFKGYVDAFWDILSNNESNSGGSVGNLDQLIFKIDGVSANHNSVYSSPQNAIYDLENGSGKIHISPSVPSEFGFNLNYKMKENFDSKNSFDQVSNLNSADPSKVSLPKIGTKATTDLTSLSNYTSRDDFLGTISRSEPVVLVQESEIFGEKNRVNILRQKTIERSDPNNSIKSEELSSIKWHDDMGISNTSARELSKEEISVGNFEISQNMKMGSKFSKNKKESSVRVSDLSEESRKRDTDPVQPGYHAPAVDHSNSSMGNEGNIQVGYLSEEDIGSVKFSLSENEELEQKHELRLPTVNSLGRELDLSNVQIIRNEDLEDLRVLGSGAFGTVYHGRWRGTDVAIKRIKNSCFAYQSSLSEKLLEEFWREAAILSKLHHPNVLAFYGVVKDGPRGSVATVAEFMVSGSLKRVLLHQDRYLDLRKRIILAMDAAIGMEYLHSKKVVHFDLKCDNLLVNLKDLSRPICKVADFGLSKMKETTMVSGGMRGTLPWMAPEQLNMSSNKVSEKIDVYSFGIVMWEILTSDEPYAGMHYGQVIGGILNNTLRPPVPSSCDADWKRLMEQCWSVNPDQRPSFTEIAGCLRSMLVICQAK